MPDKLIHYCGREILKVGFDQYDEEQNKFNLTFKPSYSIPIRVFIVSLPFRLHLILDFFNNLILDFVFL